jgi:hypothetical protein
MQNLFAGTIWNGWHEGDGRVGGIKKLLAINVEDDSDSDGSRRGSRQFDESAFFI